MYYKILYKIQVSNIPIVFKRLNVYKSYISNDRVALFYVKLIKKKKKKRKKKIRTCSVEKTSYLLPR